MSWSLAEDRPTFLFTRATHIILIRSAVEALHLSFSDELILP